MLMVDLWNQKVVLDQHKNLKTVWYIISCAHLKPKINYKVLLKKIFFQI